MISATEFRRQISKTLSGKLKELGFKGSGFNYIMDTEYFVFTIGIQASQYGGQCCAEFGIQPESIDTNGFQKLDFKKLKYYNCEIRPRIARIEKGDCWWEYSDDENENINSANEIVSLFEKRFVPVIDLFINNHDILETIETSDLDNMYKNFPKKFKGMVFGFSNTRFAWVMVKALEKTNPQKAKEFAKYGLSKLENKSTFFARVDFENLLKESNGA